MAAGQRDVSRLVPVLTPSVRDFLALRGKIERIQTLHPLMQFEALNFADGTRTVHAVYQAVWAEARAAGSWYYGTVSQADIVGLFESAEKAGVLSLK